MKSKLRAALLAVPVIAGAAILTSASPAAAAPPPISCTVHPASPNYPNMPTGWCIASDGISISAGAKNIGTGTHYWDHSGFMRARVKLIGFPDTGGIVALGVSTPDKHWLNPGEVITTPNVVWWVAGTVCSQRETWDWNNNYSQQLMHCVRN